MEETKDIFSEKLVHSYNLVCKQEELIDLTTGLLYGTNEYNFSKDLSRKLNHRQGKVRSTYSDYERQLMTSILPMEETDVANNERELVESEELVRKLNVYLSDKQDMNLDSLGQRSQNAIINQVKAFAIHLFRDKQYWLLDRLDLPHYLDKYIESTFNLVDNNNDSKISEDIYNNWINYLSQSNNIPLIDIVILNKDCFWGGMSTSHQDMFEKYFGNVSDQINDYANVYEMFRHYRKSYMDLNKKVKINSFCEIFELNINEYDKGKQAFIHEFSELFTNEDTNLIGGLFYEK
jgi:hypothetical protein